MRDGYSLFSALSRRIDHSGAQAGLVAKKNAALD
jgi:hypothetical protein